MIRHELDINGTKVSVTTSGKIDMNMFITKLSKVLNGEDTNPADAIFKGKKKFNKTIKFDER